MSGIPLIFKLLLHSFSFKKGSLRKPTFKRLAIVFLIFPICALIILINWVFLIVDNFIFWTYRKQSIKKLVFITGLPRSATSLVFHKLANDADHFTSFKLWEIIFAPSIIQKYFFRAILFIDKSIGHPLYACSKLLDRLLFKKLRGIHDMSLSKPEEDELLFIYKLSTVLFVYVFPGLHYLDNLLEFDEKIQPQTRYKLMRFYKRCLQRHNFVFNRNDNKYLLSKNPAFVSRIRSLHDTFPDSHLIYTYRSPLKTIPATISLNRHLYSIFASIDEAFPMASSTKDMLTRWYIMSNKALKEKYQGKQLVLDYAHITEQLSNTLTEIYQCLGIETTKKLQLTFALAEEKSRLFKSNNHYQDITNFIDKQELEEIALLEMSCPKIGLH